MNETDSILDKIISSKQAVMINEFDPKEIVESLIKPLAEREREILILRYGLDLDGKKTLEHIGNKFQVTRERIRQIENSALKKVKKSSEQKDILDSTKSVFEQTLELHGGIMPEDMLLEETLSLVGVNLKNKIFAHFILSQLLHDQLNFLPPTQDYHPIWKLPSASFENFQSLLELILITIEQTNQPSSITDIHSQVLQSENSHPLKESLDEKFLNSFLRASKKIQSNPFGEWGLAHWNTITLKKISDKVYLILKKEGKPLHFTGIAQKINEIGFDKKIANPATIHNELILDDKYILIGRGMYALKEWGYQSGTVADVIREILQQSAKPLSKNEIIAEVLKKRLVKKSTIVLALMDKEKVNKIPGLGYTLKTEN